MAKASIVKSPVKGARMNIKQTKIDEPDIREDEILKQDTVTEEEKKDIFLTENEKKYIINLIANGYHTKDIQKKARAIMHLSDEKIARLMKNVKRSADILVNLEG